MALKKAVGVGLAGLMLGASPSGADSLNDGTTVALTMIGGGGALSLGCLAVALFAERTETEGEGYSRRGFYAGLAANYARENFSDSAIEDIVDGELQGNLRKLRGTPTMADPGNYTFSVADLDDDEFGFSGRVGYRCNPYISTELQFDWLETFKGTLAETGVPMNDAARVFNLDIETLVFTTNVKGHLMTGRYQPYVLLGLGFMRMESKTRDVSPAALPRPSGCSMDLAVNCLAAQSRDREVRVAGRFGGGIDFYLTENVVMNAEASYLMPTGKLDDMDYYTFGIGVQYRF